MTPSPELIALLVTSKVRTCQKDPNCCICGGPIKLGERYRGSGWKRAHDECVREAALRMEAGR